MPYLFILAIEFLTKQLQRAQQARVIRGIIVAKTAPTITHAMYANDLIIMGMTNVEEV